MISTTKLQSPIYAKKEYHRPTWVQLDTPVVGDIIPMSQGMGNIPIVGSRLQLKANVTYRLFAHILFQGTVAAATGTVCWYDHTNSGLLGSYNYNISVTSAPDENSSVPGEAVITPSTDIEVELRVTTSSNVLRFYSNSYGSIYVEAIETTIPVRNISEDYSLAETDTGTNWIDGKRIYRKVVDCGAMPNATSKNVLHGILSFDKMVKVCGVMSNGSSTHPLPHPGAAGSWQLQLTVQASHVVLTGTDNWSAFSGYVILEYTK